MTHYRVLITYVHVDTEHEMELYATVPSDTYLTLTTAVPSPSACAITLRVSASLTPNGPVASRVLYGHRIMRVQTLGILDDAELGDDGDGADDEHQEHDVADVAYALPTGSGPVAMSTTVDPDRDSYVATMLATRLPELVDALRTPRTPDADDPLAELDATELLHLLDQVHRVGALLHNQEDRMLSLLGGRASLRRVAHTLDSSHEAIRRRYLRLAEQEDMDAELSP